MSHVFVSYAAVDREKAATLAAALTKLGWSVWWDRTIPPGKEFDQVIEEALDAAQCVVVLWSKASVGSRWVKSESEEAMRRKVLVPALIEDVKIPLEFRRLQAADLSKWRGEEGNSEFLKLLDSIRSLVPTGKQTSAASQGSDAEPSLQRRGARLDDGALARPPAANSASARWRKNAGVKVLSAGLAAFALMIGGFWLYDEHAKTAMHEQKLAVAERMAREQVAQKAAVAAQEQASAAKAAADSAAQEGIERVRAASEAALKAKREKAELAAKSAREAQARAERDAAAAAERAQPERGFPSP